MVFSSLLFLFYFLPVILILYYIVPRKFRNLILFISGLIFYAWGEPVYVFLMLFSTVADYIHGILIDRYKDRKNISKIVLISSVIINLGLLSFFKYFGFVLQVINDFTGASFKDPGLSLPIGISFYTFQTMSYTIDLYRKRIPVQKNFITFGAYVSLFPQLIAGPIVRYNAIAEQLENRKVSMTGFGEGVARFVLGMGKKVLIANNIGILWQQIQVMHSEELTVMTAWIGALAFGFQYFFDFSGYSDMAIGLGKMFGFDFPENFNYPYISRSITEFWRRWHISLGSWFRDYVYIPLGGNREGRFNLYRNLFIVWFLTGLWHGAGWNYILWGLYFGILITLEKTVLLKILEKIPRWATHVYTLLAVAVGWMVFAFENMSAGIGYLKAMFGLGGAGFLDNRSMYFLYTNVVILIISILASTPVFKKYTEALQEKSPRLIYVTSILGYASVMILSTAYLVDSTYNPFLYFRF